MSYVNTAKKLFSNVFLKFLALGIGVYTTRWLNANLESGVYENYNLIIAYIPIILAVLDLGIEHLIQKYFTNHEEDKELLGRVWTTFGVLHSLAYVLGLAIVLVSYRIVGLENVLVVVLLFTSKFVIILDQHYRAVTQSSNRTWQFSLVDFLTKALLFILLIAGLAYPQIATLEYFAVASLTVYSIGLVLDGIWQRREVTFGRFDTSLIMENWHRMASLGVAQIMTSFYQMSDRLFLKSFGTDSALINGYSEAYKLLEIAFVVPGLTMPAVASLWKKTVKKEGLQLGKLGQLVGVTVGLGTLSCLGLVILGPLALQLIQKNVYESAYQVLPILALSLIFFFLIIFFKNVLIFFNRERVELMISGVTGVTAVGLYIVLIGKYGVVGAAWSSVLVFAIGAITSSGFVWRTIRQEQKQDRN